MYKNFILSLIAGCLCIATSAHTQRDLLQKKTTVELLQKSLIFNQQWVSYPSYSDRPAWDTFLGEWKAEYISRGEKQLDYQWKVVKAIDYMEFERSGNRAIMENPFGSNNGAIADLMMAELAEGKGRFIDQLINGVFHTCEMTSWALSAHLSSQRAGRSLPVAGDHYIDLTVGDVGSMMSWIYYFFHSEFDKLNPYISIRLRSELQIRVLDTYMRENHFWWQAVNCKPETMVNNWNPWCNFNVLTCFMLLENNPVKLSEAVYKTMVSVDKFINYTKDDGACEEGPSYWGHAAGKMYDYLQLLYYVTDGKVSIFDNPLIKNMGEYIWRSYVGNGWVVNFADASAKGGGDAVIFRYGKAVKSEGMMQFAAYLQQLNHGGKAPNGRDVFRTLETIQYQKELSVISPELIHAGSYWYPQTEFCYLYDQSGLMLAAKGGYNSESHNHNDAGTFILYKNTVPMFIDAGVGTYTRQTFSNERYSIWTMQSQYHNLPVINGAGQAFGRNFKASEVVCDRNKNSFSANIATAYPQNAQVDKWIRSYTLKNAELKISDEFRLRKGIVPNRINFLTWGDIDTSVSGKITIQSQGQSVTMSYNPTIFNISIETIQLDDPRLSNVWGKTIYRISLTAKTIKTKGTYNFTIR